MLDIKEIEEFGWFCRRMKIENCGLISVYPFLQCRNLEINGLKMQGKYSFQYAENVTIKNSVLDTKDAFWHNKNVTVTDSICLWSCIKQDKGWSLYPLPWK